MTRALAPRMFRTSRTILLAFGLVAMMPRLGSAQPPLTLEQAIEEAMAHNRTVASARAGVAEAGAHVDAARAGRLPRINVAESWQRGNQPVFVFSSLLTSRQFAAANFAIDALNHPNPVGYFHTAIGFDQLLFDGGRRRAMTRATTVQRDLAETAVDEASDGVRLAVTQTYGRLVALAAGRRALASALETAQDDLDRVRQRREAGVATEADVLSLAVHVADLQQRTIQADGDAAIGRAELNRLAGAAIDRAFDVVEPSPATGSTLPDAAALIAAAERERPDLRRAALGESLTATIQQQARAALIPQVGAQAGVDIAGTTFADRASSWVLGGELRWTFSTGGAELAGIKAAAAAASRARIDHEDVRAQVQVEVLSAIRRLETARARVAVGRATVDQARESQRIIRDRFAAGMATVTDVLRASSAVLDADAQRTSALVDVIVNSALLNKATGSHETLR